MEKYITIRMTSKTEKRRARKEMYIEGHRFCVHRLDEENVSKGYCVSELTTGYSIGQPPFGENKTIKATAKWAEKRLKDIGEKKIVEAIKNVERI